MSFQKIESQEFFQVNDNLNRSFSFQYREETRDQRPESEKYSPLLWWKERSRQIVANRGRARFLLFFLPSREDAIIPPRHLREEKRKKEREEMKKIKREITRFIVVGQLKFTGETKVGWRFAGSSSSKGGRRRWWWFLRRGGGEEAGDCIVIYGQTWSSTANRPFDINFLSISASFLFQFPRACSMDILQVFVSCGGERRGRGSLCSKVRRQGFEYTNRFLI